MSIVARAEILAQRPADYAKAEEDLSEAEAWSKLKEPQARCAQGRLPWHAVLSGRAKGPSQLANQTYNATQPDSSSKGLKRGPDVARTARANKRPRRSPSVPSVTEPAAKHVSGIDVTRRSKSAKMAAQRNGGRDARTIASRAALIDETARAKMAW